MKSAKTALGKTINMAALAAKNETERAVSNVPVNARGDIIDNRGNVKISKEVISKEFNKDILVGIESTVSIKEDTIKSDQPAESTVDPTVFDVYNDDRLSTALDKVVETDRILRTRDDGSTYYEIEFSDGSMSEESIDD